MGKRPKIKLTLTTTDKIIEVIGWLSVIAIWILTLSHYNALPEIIPTHYNAMGKADGFGEKEHILTLPLVATVLFIGLTILNKYPHMFNHLGEITEENARFQYTIATRMLRILKIVIVINFGLIVYSTIQNVQQNTDSLGGWFIPIFFVSIFTPIIYYLIKSSNGGK